MYVETRWISEISKSITGPAARKKGRSRARCAWGDTRAISGAVTCQEIEHQWGFSHGGGLKSASGGVCL